MGRWLARAIDCYRILFQFHHSSHIQEALVRCQGNYCFAQILWCRGHQVCSQRIWLYRLCNSSRAWGCVSQHPMVQDWQAPWLTPAPCVSFTGHLQESWRSAGNVDNRRDSYWSKFVFLTKLWKYLMHFKARAHCSEHIFIINIFYLLLLFLLKVTDYYRCRWRSPPHSPFVCRNDWHPESVYFSLHMFVLLCSMSLYISVYCTI